jgi:hypothetical protein
LAWRTWRYSKHHHQEAGIQAEGLGQLQAGSWNNYRADADFTTPVTDSFAIRVNGAYENAESYRQYVHSRRYFSRHRLFGKLATRPAFLTNWNLHHRKFRSIMRSPSTTQ